MVVYVWLLRSERPLLRLAGCVALIASGLLTLLLLRRGGVSLEDRHLRPAGILLLAAALQLAADVRQKWLARTLLTSVALACTFGIASAGQAPCQRSHATPSGPRTRPVSPICRDLPCVDLNRWIGSAPMEPG